MLSYVSALASMWITWGIWGNGASTHFCDHSNLMHMQWVWFGVVGVRKWFSRFLIVLLFPEAYHL